MYNQTSERDEFYSHIECGCGRQYRAEEMYICYNCNKILCRFCLSEEIEYCACKNYCKINQSLSVNQAKKMKNSCDQCLECPLCGVALIKRNYNGYLFTLQTLTILF